MRGDYEALIDDYVPIKHRYGDAIDIEGFGVGISTEET